MNERTSQARVAIPRAQLAVFCRKNHIRTLSLFGSVLRDDFGAESDIDVLVEFDPEHVPGLIALGGMERELSELLGGRKIDLVTKGFINHRLRDRILSEAVEQYAER
jgi:hypothetical protein